MTTQSEALNALEQALTRIHRMFPGATRSWADPGELARVVVVWGEALAERGLLSPAALKRGMHRVADHPGSYPPSLPEFARYCMASPHDLGCPDLDRAYRIAVDCSHPAAFGGANWVHPTIYAAALAVGCHALSTLPENKIRQAFAEHYATACNAFGNGDSLPALPAPREENRGAKASAQRRAASAHAGHLALDTIRDRLRMPPSKWRDLVNQKSTVDSG